jgi:hypothetical protein
MTAPVTLMDYDEVGWLATRVKEAAATLQGGHSALAGSPGTHQSVPVPSVPDMNAFGNTPVAGSVSSAYSRTKSAAATAAEGLTSVLQDDVARLDEVKRTFQETDHASADQISAAAGRGNLSVYSAHVHSDGSNNNDLVRAGQIEQMQETFNQSPGVIGADFNAEVGDGNLSSGAIQGFEDDGHTIDGGEVGGTSHSGRSIDYVVTAPGVSPSGAELVDGATSDHDGQRVDLTVSRW